MAKNYTITLEDTEIQALEELSKRAKIPEAELLREAVKLLIQSKEKNQSRMAFLRRVDKDLEEDREAMERLAQL